MLVVSNYNQRKRFLIVAVALSSPASEVFRPAQEIIPIAVFLTSNARSGLAFRQTTNSARGNAGSRLRYPGGQKKGPRALRVRAGQPERKWEETTLRCARPLKAKGPLIDIPAKRRQTS
jgi:hypothetical protein